MSTTIRLTTHGEALLQKQLATGSFHSPEEVVEKALETLAESGGVKDQGPSAKSAADAVENIRQNRKGVTLGGIKIKDLIHEGHRF
jgi:Arc/MetJ-type ribon-helix-helix transcriptional regulator